VRADLYFYGANPARLASPKSKRAVMTNQAKAIFKTIDNYLDAIGADIIENSNNPYELVRFVANEEICVIYQGKKGCRGNNPLANKIIENFYAKKIINIQSEKRKSLKDKFYDKLIERDGNICFYSGKEMTKEDASIEHLIPLSKGGKNNLDNLVLCLKSENEKMANLALIEKIKYKINNLTNKN
jgi:5-methylcytosine-specific restriction endonuclease McrA